MIKNVDANCTNQKSISLSVCEKKPPKFVHFAHIMMDGMTFRFCKTKREIRNGRIENNYPDSSPPLEIFKI